MKFTFDEFLLNFFLPYTFSDSICLILQTLRRPHPPSFRGFYVSSRHPSQIKDEEEIVKAKSWERKLRQRIYRGAYVVHGRGSHTNMHELTSSNHSEKCLQK